MHEAPGSSPAFFCSVDVFCRCIQPQKTIIRLLFSCRAAGNTRNVDTLSTRQNTWFTPGQVAAASNYSSASTPLLRFWTSATREQRYAAIHHQATRGGSGCTFNMVSTGRRHQRFMSVSFAFLPVKEIEFNDTEQQMLFFQILKPRG